MIVTWTALTGPRLAGKDKVQSKTFRLHFVSDPEGSEQRSGYRTAPAQT